MHLLEAVRRHPLWSGAVLGGVLGAIIGLFLPIRAPQSAPAPDPEWGVPTLAATRAYTEAMATTVRAAGYWGEQARAGRREPPRATWALKAIATRPTPRIAVTHGPRNEILWVGLQEALPDGGVLVALDRDTAWVERDGCRSPKRLYPMPTDAASDPCAQAGDAPAPASTASNRTPPQSQKTDTP